VDKAETHARTELRNGAALQPTSEEQQMEIVELSQRQSARMPELPEDYRVAGVERSAPLVRKPSGQIVRIQQNGRLTAATLLLATALADERLTH
jgi:hypothetical protein